MLATLAVLTLGFAMVQAVVFAAPAHAAIGFSKSTLQGVLRTFVVSVQNDGVVSDSYTVRGPSSSPASRSGTSPGRPTSRRRSSTVPTG